MPVSAVPEHAKDGFPLLVNAPVSARAGDGSGKARRERTLASIILPTKIPDQAAILSATLNQIAPRSFIAPISGDMDAVNQVIRTQLHSRVPLVNQIAEYIINAGGKRIRPVIVLLMA